MPGPQFDGSLASVARDLHLAAVGLAAFAVTLALYIWLERRERNRWLAVPTATLTMARNPYRSSEVISAHLARAPRLVRLASFFNLAFGHLFGPVVLVALAKYPFDGIEIPLFSGVVLALLNWNCGRLLLSRSRSAVAVARSVAAGSLMANVGLLGVAGAHLFVVELDQQDGIEHACSSSVTFIVLVFAVFSIVQAVLTVFVVKVHERSLRWTPSTAAPALFRSSRGARVSEESAVEEVDDRGAASRQACGRA